MRLVFGLVCLPIFIFAQHIDAPKSSIGLGCTYGKILVHTKKITSSIPSFSYGLDASYSFITNGSKPWHALRNFPVISINASIIHYNTKQLGTVFGCYPSMERIIYKKSSWKPVLKFGAGIGYITKHWERNNTSDSTNNIVGSHINNFTNIQIGIKKNIGQSIEANFGIGFTHVSNAAMRTPNYGINYAAFFCKASYMQKKIVQQQKTKTQDVQIMPRIKNKIRYNIRYAYSMVEDSKAYNGPMYPIKNMSIYASKVVHQKNNYFIGIDAMYYTRMVSLYKSREQYIGKERKHAIRYAIIGGNEFLFGSFGLPVQAGYYINKLDGGFSWYQQIGITYHFYSRPNKIIKDMSVSALLKSHLANADCGLIAIQCSF